MILSDVDIKKYIQEGKIEISNFDEAKLYPASYAFSLGEKLLQPIGGDVIDFKKKLLPEYKEILIEEFGYELQAGEFILAQTKESISLNNSIAMFIEGRSTLARVGIEVVMTSAFIEPNHKDSIITLEIKNNSKSSFMLYADMKFAKGIFFQLSSTPSAVDQNGKMYVTQGETTPPQIKAYF